MSFVHSKNSICYHDYSAIIVVTGITSLANNTVYVPNIEIVTESQTALIMKDVVTGTRYSLYISGGTITCHTV